MSGDSTLRRLRIFLQLLAATLFAGTIVELLAAKHYADLLQLVPFGLCGLGLLTLGVVWTRPSRLTVLALRATMTVIALGSLLGVYEHIRGNLEFAREIHPRASTISLLQTAFTGRNPLGAPGLLAVAAAVAIAATVAMVTDPAEEMSRHHDIQPGPERSRSRLSTPW